MRLYKKSTETHQAWTWPDHIIRKRESRQIREEHNATVDSHVELLVALESFLRAPHIGSDGPGSSTIVVQDFNLRDARTAIANAKATKGGA